MQQYIAVMEFATEFEQLQGPQLAHVIESQWAAWGPDKPQYQPGIDDAATARPSAVNSRLVGMHASMTFRDGAGFIQGVTQQTPEFQNLTNTLMTNRLYGGADPDEHESGPETYKNNIQQFMQAVPSRVSGIEIESARRMPADWGAHTSDSRHGLWHFYEQGERLSLPGDLVGKAWSADLSEGRKARPNGRGGIWYPPAARVPEPPEAPGVPERREAKRRRR